MAEPRGQTRSAGARRQEQSDTQFSSNQLDPILIERGQTEAIQLVRNTVNTTMTTPAVASSSITQPSEATEPNTTDMSRVPPMVFAEDKGLEEQFLTGIKLFKKSWT